MDANNGLKQIVILGGGVGAMTAAFELTEKDGWEQSTRSRSTSWAGGSAARARAGATRDRHDRIEEHGLHVWFGFYENAFNLIQRCYAAANYKAPNPFTTWRAAFTPQNYVVWEDEVNGAWRHFPVTVEVSGDVAVVSRDDLAAGFLVLLEYVAQLFRIDLHRQRRRSDQIAKEDRELAPLSAHLPIDPVESTRRSGRGCPHRERGGALAAEPRGWRALCSTGVTGDRERHRALVTKPRIGRAVDRTSRALHHRHSHVS